MTTQTSDHPVEPRQALCTVDLDRTLIYSAAAIAEGATIKSPAADLLASAHCVEIYQGLPQSFMSPRAMASLLELDAVAHVVPTTTRTIEQYRRIELPIGVPNSRSRATAATSSSAVTPTRVGRSGSQICWAPSE